VQLASESTQIGDLRHRRIAEVKRSRFYRASWLMVVAHGPMPTIWPAFELFLDAKLRRPPPAISASERRGRSNRGEVSTLLPPTVALSAGM
jgi:hypothetical protein